MRSNRRSVSVGDLNDIGVEPSFYLFPNSELHGEAYGRLSVSGS